MKYFVFRDNWDYNKLKDEEPFEPYEWHSLNLGIEIEEDIPEINLCFDDNAAPNSIPNVHQILVFDQKLIDILKKFEMPKIQYFPIKVTLNDGSSLEYSSLNILNVVDCIDKANSNLAMGKDEEGEFILGINSLKLNEEKINNEVLFRLGGAETFLVVREDLAQEIVNAGCTGLEFYNSDGFRD